MQNNVSLPHLVYQLTFHENSNEKDVWKGNNDLDILNNIIQDALEENSSPDSKGGSITKTEQDSKVIVVLELPVGGSVSKYCVGESDDTLEVEIQKHSLMLNPKALLYSGIKAGVLDPQTDGPQTARGGI